MTDFKKIIQVVFSMLFSIALMFPLVVKFFHVFECHSHEKVSCINNDGTSIDQDEIDCQICDFSFVPSNYSIEHYSELFNPNVPSKNKIYSSFLFLKTFKRSSAQLRAPPYFLV